MEKVISQNCGRRNFRSPFAVETKEGTNSLQTWMRIDSRFECQGEGCMRAETLQSFRYTNIQRR